MPRLALASLFALFAPAVPLALAETPVAAAPAAAEPAAPSEGPALQPVWADFERLRLPAASPGEDSTALEAYLDGLKRREGVCIERLPHAASLRKYAADLRATLERTATDLHPLQVAERVTRCGDGITVKVAEGAERGTPFQVDIGGPGGKRGLSNGVVCAITALPAWRVGKLEAGPDGWKATGMLQLLEGTLAVAPKPEIPAKAAVEGRRSAELRLRIQAAQPAIDACEKRIAEEGLEGLDELETRVEQAEALRPIDALVRPTILLTYVLSNLGAEPLRSLLVKADGDGAHLELAPLAAAVPLRKQLRNPLAGLRVGAETYGDDRLELHVWRKETPRTLRAFGRTTDDPAFQRLLALMDAVRTKGGATLTHAEPDLAAAARALLDHAEALGPLLDDARLFESRRDELVAAIAAQGIGVDPKVLKEKAAACKAKLEGKPPKASGQPEKVEFKGSFEDGPVPYDCLRKSLRSFVVKRHVRAGKNWKLAGEIVLVAPPSKKAPPVVLPPLPELPTRINRTRGNDAKSWRLRIQDLHAFLKTQHDRLGKLPLGEIAALEQTYDTLSAHEQWSPVAIPFHKVFFEPPPDFETPPWFDYTFATLDEVKLNAAPKDKAWVLSQALKKAGCRVLKSKAVGDSMRSELDCDPASTATPKGK